MSDERQATRDDQPRPPAPRLSAWDFTMLGGIPLIVFLGGLGSASGAAAGFVLVCFAALAIVTFHAVRSGRRNQPRLPRYLGVAAVIVAVVAVTTGWNLLQYAPVSMGSAALLAAVPVALFGVFAVLTLRGSR